VNNANDIKNNLQTFVASNDLRKSKTLPLTKTQIAAMEKTQFHAANNKQREKREREREREQAHDEHTMTTISKHNILL
jgi:hypothetical protein